MALLRHRLFIDPDVQGVILWRTGLYSLACGIYFAGILVFTESMGNPDAPFWEGVVRSLDEAIYWIPGLAVLGPVIAYDILRVSNRFTGPAFRLHREMQRLVNDESERPLNFREDDYWQDMAVVFNEIRDELTRLRSVEQLAAAERREQEPEMQARLFDEDEPETADDFLEATNV